MEDTKATRKAIGDRIRQARIACGMTNASEFGRQTYVTPNTVYRWERGEVAPSIFSLFDIAATCRVSMEWLVGGSERGAGKVFDAWLETPSGLGASVEAQTFLGSLPMLGYEASLLFYDLALVAWQNGLSREEASRLAKTTQTHTKH